MKLRQLHAFRAVMQTSSATQAAQLLNITQPAVSSLITSLENEVGFQLFQRRKRHLHATTEGEYFYREVERTLANLDHLSHVAEDIRNLKVGQLRVACLPGLSSVLLPKVVAEFLSDKPDVTVHLETCNSKNVEEWITSQQFDVGLAERALNDPSVAASTLTMRCVCVFPVGHPLSQLRQVTPNDLSGLPFISLEESHPTSFHLTQAFVHHGAHLNVKIRTTLFPTACRLVENDAGVSVVDPVSAHACDSTRLEVRPFVPSIPFKIKVMYPILKGSSHLAMALISVLLEHMQQFTME